MSKILDILRLILDLAIEHVPKRIIAAELDEAETRRARRVAEVAEAAKFGGGHEP